MFGNRDRLMPDFRARGGMNMSHMGPRPLDLPPMDMRRMDGPPMRGRDMDPREFRGRQPNRDFFRPGEQPDFSLRRHYDNSVREKLNNSNFPGSGRNSIDMGGRGMPPREQNNRFNDARNRESFNYGMPQFNNPNSDGRRGGFPVDGVERNDGFRDMSDRPSVGIGGSDRFNMDLPSHERRIMDNDRQGGPPFNPRGGFESDIDFRSRLGPSAEFRGRDRSPLRFGNNDVSSGDRTRSDMPSGVAGSQRSHFVGTEDRLGEREYPDSGGSPLTDYRSGEELTLAEEWKNRQKDKNTFLNMNKNMGAVSEGNFPVGFGSDMALRDPPPFQEPDRSSVEFPGKNVGFPHSERFPPVDLPPISSKALQEHSLPEISLLTSPRTRENENEKHWLRQRDQKQSQNKLNPDDRPPLHKENNLATRDIQVATDCFKGLKDIAHDQGTGMAKIGQDGDFPSSRTVQVRDQDYRDIDYRTASGRAFDYKHEVLPAPEKLIKAPKPMAGSKFDESGSQVGLYVYLFFISFLICKYL